MGCLGAIMGSLGATMGCLGAIMGSLGAIMGCLGAIIIITIIIISRFGPLTP